MKDRKIDPLDIYQDLKKKIIWLDFEPGYTLNLAELAESYGVSRNPLTIALTRLNSEQWVVRQGSHFVVSPLTLNRIREITEIRSVLEVQAHTWAMHRITPEEMTELKRLAAEIKNLKSGVSNKEIVQVDVKFHWTLFKACRNDQLFDMLDWMLSHYLRFWLSFSGEINKEKFFLEVLDIIKAIEEKDEIRLKAASIAHIRLSLDEIMGIERLS